MGKKKQQNNKQIHELVIFTSIKFNSHNIKIRKEVIGVRWTYIILRQYSQQPHRQSWLGLVSHKPATLDKHTSTFLEFPPYTIYSLSL